MLPIDYEGPQLTLRMQNYIDENDISKFNPHTNMRSELLSLIFDDVTKSHQLLSVVICLLVFDFFSLDIQQMMSI